MRISDWSSDVCSSDLPLAHKRANLPGPDNERFRMSNPTSIRGTLLKIGAVFGGPSYTTDPYQRVASNIGELSQLGDNAPLQEELRRKSALCARNAPRAHNAALRPPSRPEKRHAGRQCAGTWRAR